MALRKSNPAFLNGVPELLILELLSRRPMHGYELVQTIPPPPTAAWNLARAASIRSCTAWNRTNCSQRAKRPFPAACGWSIAWRPRARPNWPIRSAPGGASWPRSTRPWKEERMDAQQWLNQLQAALARQKLPPFYVERLVAELSDHITDSLEDRMSTDAKDLRHFTSPLGSPTAVAAAAIGEFRKRRFSTRHPVLTFVVMPRPFARVWLDRRRVLVRAGGPSHYLAQRRIWRGRFPAVADRMPSCFDRHVRVGCRSPWSPPWCVEWPDEQQLAGSGRWQPASSWLWSAAPRCST